VICALAVWKLGAVVAALNPIYTEHELATLLRATGARFAIALTRVYAASRPCQPQTALELVVATNIKEYSAAAPRRTLHAVQGRKGRPPHHPRARRPLVPGICSGPTTAPRRRPFV
jgi:acyl-CoA synthetase (AMP-forming)/AMP-acid ligase II